MPRPVVRCGSGIVVDVSGERLPRLSGDPPTLRSRREAATEPASAEGVPHEVSAGLACADCDHPGGASRARSGSSIDAHGTKRRRMAWRLIFATVVAAVAAPAGGAPARSVACGPSATWQPATQTERAMARRAFVRSLRSAQRYMLNPTAKHRREMARLVPRPQPYGHYVRWASSKKLPLKIVEFDIQQLGRICTVTRSGRDRRHPVVTMTAVVEWYLRGDTAKLKPWPYFARHWIYGVVGRYFISSGKIVRFVEPPRE